MGFCSSKRKSLRFGLFISDNNWIATRNSFLEIAIDINDCDWTQFIDTRTHNYWRTKIWEKWNLQKLIIIGTKSRLENILKADEAFVSNRALNFAYFLDERFLSINFFNCRSNLGQNFGSRNFGSLMKTSTIDQLLNILNLFFDTSAWFSRFSLFWLTNFLLRPFDDSFFFYFHKLLKFHWNDCNVILPKTISTTSSNKPIDHPTTRISKAPLNCSMFNFASWHPSIFILSFFKNV